MQNQRQYRDRNHIARFCSLKSWAPISLDWPVTAGVSFGLSWLGF
jgi:hypothetical protein